MADTSRAAQPTVPAQQFFDVDIRVGRVVSCEALTEARTPAYRLRVDFGELGVKRSAARLTDLYSGEELTGRLVVGVVNLPPRQVGPVRSEVLILGVYRDGGQSVVLLQPERECAPGDRVGLNRPRRLRHRSRRCRELRTAGAAAQAVDVGSVRT